MWWCGQSLTKIGTSTLLLSGRVINTQGSRCQGVVRFLLGLLISCELTQLLQIKMHSCTVHKVLEFALHRAYVLYTAVYTG